MDTTEKTDLLAAWSEDADVKAARAATDATISSVEPAESISTMCKSYEDT